MQRRELGNGALLELSSGNQEREVPFEPVWPQTDRFRAERLASAERRVGTWMSHGAGVVADAALEVAVLLVPLPVGVTGQARLAIGHDHSVLDEPGDGYVVGQEVAVLARAVCAGNRAFVVVGGDLVSVYGTDVDVWNRDRLAGSSRDDGQVISRPLHPSRAAVAEPLTHRPGPTSCASQNWSPDRTANDPPTTCGERWLEGARAPTWSPCLRRRVPLRACLGRQSRTYWRGNTWSCALNAACHCEIGEIRRALWCCSGGTAISGTCHSQTLLAPYSADLVCSLLVLLERDWAVG